MRRLSAVSVVTSFRSYISALMGAIAALAFAASANAGVQSLDSIQAAAEQFVRSSLPEKSPKHFITAGNLDPRLRLDQCASPLEAFSQGTGLNTGRMTIGVRCPSAAPWTIYVPVTVEAEVSVLVLRRPLARRSRVELADVEPQVRRMPGRASIFVNDVATLQGHRLKRSLPVGTALTVDMLQPDVLVRRGQQVTLIAANGSVQIRAQGQALTEGAVDERVRVQNVSSLKVVEGVVESDGVVRVGL
ncbi:flagellar basal body P-ring formation chaperone FlgA [Steroidobacter cummioxidans]|uniref:flagellar basal body P-ring formation chaperone FlgA n=1 Tax=Steroidobacter cummioxidans TaxID=1803913 RepID=UPI00137AD5C3|nr:flagellar basal body P-ring formation chaperone FlgA [Steroidobacter cummioxidans]